MRIELPSGTPAALVMPDDPVRGVVIHPDVGGLRPLFDELCQRLAAERRWAACAPEPFPGQEQLTLPERMEAMSRLSDQQQLGDLTAAADELRRRGAGAVAVIGFCMGGMYALKAAATGAFDRVVSFYGMIRVPEQWRGPEQGEPLEAVAMAGAPPVLAIIGEADPWTPSADVDALEAAGATVVRYPDAEHGFVHDPTRPAHRPGDAADAWGRVYDFLS